MHRCVANFIFAISYFYRKRFIKNPGGLFYERGRHSLMSLVLSVTGFCPGEIRPILAQSTTHPKMAEFGNGRWLCLRVLSTPSGSIG